LVPIRQSFRERLRTCVFLFYDSVKVIAAV
jgi:hypothetical protein